MGMGRPLLWMQGSRAVVVVAGHQVLQWGSRVKGKKTHLLCFLVSVSGAVGTDTMGQVISCVYGEWLGDDGGRHHHQGWVRVWGEGVWGGCGLA
jgi:hypothetical protein